MISANVDNIRNSKPMTKKSLIILLLSIVSHGAPLSAQTWKSPVPDSGICKLMSSADGHWKGMMNLTPVDIFVAGGTADVIFADPPAKYTCNFEMNIGDQSVGGNRPCWEGN